METAILILILVLCLCLVYVTELMKKMCNRMNWLETLFDNFKDYSNKEFADIEKQFVSIKDDNAKKWAEYSKEYSEIMELLLAKHNEINELRDQLKSLESKVKEDEDSSCEDISSLRSKLNGLDYQIKKNEEDTYNAINDKVEYFSKQINNLNEMYSKVTYSVSVEKHFNKQFSSLHDEINDINLRLKSLEDKIKENEDDNCDNFYTVHSQINALNSRVKKNEEDKVKGDEYCLYDEVYGLRARLDALDYKVNESKNYLCENLYEIDSRFDVLDSTIDGYKKTLNEIRTEMSKKEGKEEND